MQTTIKQPKTPKQQRTSDETAHCIASTVYRSLCDAKTLYHRRETLEAIDGSILGRCMNLLAALAEVGLEKFQKESECAQQPTEEDTQLWSNQTAARYLV